MKKALSIVMVLLMIFAFAACGSDDKSDSNSGGGQTEVEKYFAGQEDTIAEGIESGLEAQFGECEAIVKVKGNGLTVDCKIMKLSNVDEDIKAQMQEKADQMESMLDNSVAQIRNELEDFEYYTVNICDASGNVLASATGR